MVTADQIADWQNLDAEVMDETRRVLPSGSENIHNIRPDRADATKVACEKGVAAKFVERVGEPVSRAFQALSIPRVFGEYPRGDNAVQCAGSKEPNFTMQNNQEEVRVVGEAKTFWTTDLSLEMVGTDDHEDARAVLGELCCQHQQQASLRSRLIILKRRR